jgi:hypothetical protein
LHRLRIKERFKDGDKCTVQLKDKAKVFVSLDEEDWYIKAFGPKRNIMKIIFKVEHNNLLKDFENIYFEVLIKFTLFPELA